MNSNVSYENIENQFQQLFIQYGKNINTIGIQATYAEFLAFKRNNPENGISILKEALKFPLNEFQIGHLKTKLADILVFTGKFSSALIYYTQVQNDLKNHTIGQEARFKIAQTSFFKGDFEWAQSQLKVLKNSTSQLIANDALDLNLLITDNAVKDSLKIALKKYALADLLTFQNKNKEAIDVLVNNAGVSMPVAINDPLIEEQWDRGIDILLSSHMRLIRESLPYLSNSAAPRIINVSSTEGVGGSAAASIPR